MSSLQSLRQLISERLAAAAEEICRRCEGTIVQYEQELCRQRRLLDSSWKPQLQLHHIELPQCLMTEEEDLCIQQRNFRVEQEEPERPQTKEEQEEPEPPHTKEEQEEPEPPQMKEEPGELCISQDEDQLDLKQETDTLMEIPTYEEDENSEADLNNKQSFNVTDSQDEEGNQHEESTSSTDRETESSSTTDEETDPQNRDQRKRRDSSHVQSVDSSHMSAGLLTWSQPQTADMLADVPAESALLSKLMFPAEIPAGVPPAPSFPEFLQPDGVFVLWICFSWMKRLVSSL